MKFTNDKNIPIPLALWLATDTYDYSDDPYTISATSLLKPLRMIVLERQMSCTAGVEASVDLSTLVPSRLGTATHDAVEKAWTGDYREGLRKLGLSQEAIDNFVVNPEPGTTLPGQTVVFIEKRGYRQLGKWTVSGKFDFVVDGQVQDIKTTKVYNWINGGNNEDYRRQGSIYKWIFPEIITKDVMTVLYLFQDWTKLRALAENDYPNSALMPKELALVDVDVTEAFIKDRLDRIESLVKLPQIELPECSTADLWQNETTFAYYKNPKNTNRATRVFQNMADAQVRNASDGGRGLIVRRPGEVKRCGFCNARAVCQQAARLELEGLIKA